MKLITLFMLSINILILAHSVIVGHFQALAYNVGWISSITGWIVIYLAVANYIILNSKNTINILLPRICVGGSVGLLLYARYFSSYSYTEVLGWMSSAGVWAMVLAITIGWIEIKR